MPTKKSKPKTVSVKHRIDRYKEVYRAKTVPLWFKKTMPEGAALLEDWLTNQDELEKQVFAQLDTDGFTGDVQLYYAAFARRLFACCLRFWDNTYTKEKTSLKNEFVLRGLDSGELDKLITLIDAKCMQVRRIVVTLQDIEDKLDNASHGLAALKTLLDDLESKLDDGTHGLAALKTLVDNLEGKLDDASHGLVALKTLIDDVEGKLDDGTHGLAALKTLIDALEGKLDNATYGLSALKTLIDTVEGKLDNATYGLNALYTDIAAIETKLDDPTNGLVAIKSELDTVESTVNSLNSIMLDILLEETNVWNILNNPTYGLAALNTDLDTLLSRLTATRAGYLDNLSGGAVALEATLTAIKGVGWSDETLVEIDADCDNIEAMCSDATYGLSALNTDLDTLLTRLSAARAGYLDYIPRMIHCMTFLSVINNDIDLPVGPANTDLPNVVVSGVPAGATVDKALVFLIVRAIENTNAGGVCAINGTSYINIKKSTGAWGVNDINAIQLIDNMWTVAASTREFGDVIGSDDARDVHSVVDGNATYNLRFSSVAVDLASLRLNDVQVLIKVWYH